MFQWHFLLLHRYCQCLIPKYMEHALTIGDETLLFLFFFICFLYLYVDMMSYFATNLATKFSNQIPVYINSVTENLTTDNTRQDHPLRLTLTVAVVFDLMRLFECLLLINLICQSSATSFNWETKKQAAIYF